MWPLFGSRVSSSPCIRSLRSPPFFQHFHKSLMNFDSENGRSRSIRLLLVQTIAPLSGRDSAFEDAQCFCFFVFFIQNTRFFVCLLDTRLYYGQYHRLYIVILSFSRRVFCTCSSGNLLNLSPSILFKFYHFTNSWFPRKRIVPRHSQLKRFFPKNASI